MNNQAITSRNIPLPIKREVRRRCGFGCVICGLPLYEYEHMLGWASTKRHVADEITLLCDQHHREKTSGLLPIERIIEANNSPINLNLCVSKPYDFHYAGNTCITDIGSLNFQFDFSGAARTTTLCVDGNDLLAFTLEEDHLFLNLLLFDDSNNLVMHIADNQLIYSASFWDVELTGRRLIIRDAPREILIDIQFEVPNKIIISRGRFQCNGIEIIIKPDELIVSNNIASISNCFYKNANAGIVIGPNGPSHSIVLNIPDATRVFPSGTTVKTWVGELSLPHDG